jgi:chromosome segregation ATPase
MKKTASILVAVALVAAVAYGIYQWAFDGYAPSPKDMIKRQLTKLIGDVEVKVSKANKTVAEFGEAVGQLKTHCLRTGQHVQTLADKETQARQKVETVESELRLIKGKIEAKQPVQYNDGSTLHPEEVEARVSARGEELAASRECLQIIVSDRESFEKLHEEQLKQLRMAPIHQETLRTRLATLRQKLDI